MDTPILVALIGAGGPILSAIVTFALTRLLDARNTAKLKEEKLALSAEAEGIANEDEAEKQKLREEIAKLRTELGKSPDVPIDEEDEVDEDDQANEENDGSSRHETDTKESAGKDAFGSRLGTKVSRVNQVLTDAPKSMREIMLEAGVSDTMYNHLNKLVYGGYVEKTDDGKYKLKSSPLSALDAAAKLLSENGEAMSCKEMIAAMEEKRLWKSPGGKTPDATLSASIYKEINSKGQKSRFKKTEPGTFAFNGSTVTSSKPNPYDAGTISHKLFEIIGANPNLTGGGIIAKTGDTAQYKGKYYNARAIALKPLAHLARSA